MHLTAGISWAHGLQETQMRPHLTIQLPDSWGTVFGEGLRVSFQEEALLFPGPACLPNAVSPPGIFSAGPAFPALVLVQLKGKGGESQHRR